MLKVESIEPPQTPERRSGGDDGEIKVEDEEVGYDANRKGVIKDMVTVSE